MTLKESQAKATASYERLMKALERPAIAPVHKQGAAPMTAKDEIQQRIRAMLKDGTAGNPTHALDQIVAARPDLWTQYMREPPSVVKAAPVEVRKAAPEHWSVVKLKELVSQRVQKAAPPLSDSAAWSAVLASPEGKVLVDAYYTAHPHLRRQGG